MLRPDPKILKYKIERKEENDYFRKSKEYQSLSDFGHYYPGVEDETGR